MKRKVALLVIPMMVVAMMGCGGATEAPVDLTPKQLGELGAEIYLHEDQTEEILSEANLTEEAFRTKIGEISSNPDQAREYRQAFERRLENR